jgi:UDP-3-O-[3-hydroxymyristoyl] glucosamine N-acyltransferase
MRLSDHFTVLDYTFDAEFTRFGSCDAEENDTISYCEDVGYLAVANKNANIRAVFARKADLDLLKDAPKIAIIYSENPKAEFWKFFQTLAVSKAIEPSMEYFRSPDCSIDPSAYVSDKTFISKGVIIGPQAYIGDCTILGERTFIGPGAKIGVDGLQSFLEKSTRRFVQHAGGVRIGADVVILSGAIISRGVFPTKFTSIGDETHISLLSSVGHESIIGSRCSIAGNCLIGGGVAIEDNVIIGPSATIKDGVRIGKNSKIRIGSVVVSDVIENGDVSGNFAISHIKFLRNYAKLLR